MTYKYIPLEEYISLLADTKANVFFAYAPVETRNGDPLFRGCVEGACRLAVEHDRRMRAQRMRRRKRKAAKS